MAKRSKTEAAESKVTSASALAGLGGAIGSVFGPGGGAIGAGLGGVTGLIIGDNTTVFPIDMIAIPAFQAYLIDGSRGGPEFTVYIKAGETLVPTGGNVLDMTENMDIEAAAEAPTKRKRAPGAGLPKKYAKMGFAKGWKAYKKTPAYKRKQSKKKSTRRKK